MGNEDLKKLDSHFAFGENWQNYSQLIDEKRIEVAIKDLSRLLPKEELAGRTFLDIGCGSGLHSLAALRLGAASVTSTDIDPKSVETTRQVIERFNSGKQAAIKQNSVFDLSTREMGTFDIVYSWGVLHHTGDMYGAIRKAASLVAPKGVLVLALYRETKMCQFWKVEKRFYTKAPAFIKFTINIVFSLALLLDQLRRGNNPIRYIRNYSSNRGMSFYHDIKDWLGGYPYESISRTEMHALAESLGFSVRREFVAPSGLGLFGSGCDEFVLNRTN